MREIDTYEDLADLDEIFGDLNLTMLHTNEKHLVFVYGTLMKCQRNYSRLADGGARLIDENAYHLGTVSMKSRETSGGYLVPIVVQEPAHEPLAIIIGEVYEISDQLLNMLDTFEGHPDVYAREKAFIYTTAGLVEMWMYYYVADIPANVSQEKITITEDGSRGLYHYKWRGL
jgi:gamma-glutamylcyclotransferase (GGCT)/AIG2-like uncharacterized protein YtfP